MHHWCTSMHWCFCWCSALIWLENTWFSSPFAPDLASLPPLFSFSQLQTTFWSLSFLSFRHDDKQQKSWAPDFRVERKFAKVTCRPLLCCQARWWRPGRVETSRRSGGWTSTSSAFPPRALLVVRASLTPPSLSIWLLTLPVKDGVELIFIFTILLPIVTDVQGMWTKDYILALANSLLFLTGFMALLPHDLFATSFEVLSIAGFEIGRACR